MESSSTISPALGASGRRPDADRSAAAHGGQPPRDRRGPYCRRQRLDHVVGAAPARRGGRRRPGEARRRPRRHGRDHARQPPRVPHRRPGRDDARRHPVLDLPHVSAGGDPIPGRRRRLAGRGRRAGVPANDARGAQAPARARACDRRRRRRLGRHDLARRRRGLEPRFRRREGRRRDRARRPRHADLHLGHDRAAEGRSAGPPQRHVRARRRSRR